jgi:hypothetical protein
MEQKNRFVEALAKYDHDIWLTFNPDSLNKNNHNNWFMMFNPKSWGKYLKGFGVHYAFLYYMDSDDGGEYIRFPVGVENPFKNEYRKQFKSDVVSYIKQNDVNVDDCKLWPDVGFRKTKLMEPKLIELNNNSWEGTIENYIMLKDFNNVVAKFLNQYNASRCFMENRYDPV